MIVDRPHPSAGRSRSLAQLERDAALSRVSRLRRGLIVGAAALIAGFAALVSAITPGRSAAHTRTPAAAQPTGSASNTAHTRMPPLAGAGALGLQGPSSAPQSSSPAPQSSSPGPSAPAPATSPAPAVSGGS